MAFQKENKINSVVDTALKNLSSMIDVNTVVGKPIKTAENEYIIPITKVTVGILSGGGEYGKVSIFKDSSDLPFSAGNGAIISLNPSGFLLKNTDGEYKFISSSGKPFDKILDKTMDIVEKLQGDDPS